MTYSIVARDPNTGELGVAVQSRYFAAARLVPWAEAGVGAVATQSFTETAYGPRGLALMRSGMSAPDALAKLVQEDAGEALRQVAMVDAQGRVAVHTGARCVFAAGHRAGEQVSVQANMMEKATVWDAMLDAYQHTRGDLAERMMAACEAGQREGGDIRGKQSAALIVVPGQPSDRPWQDQIFDLRIDDHPDPIGELRRLLDFARCHQRVEAATQKASMGELEAALAELEACCRAYPKEPEFASRRALFLAGAGRIPEAVQRLAELRATHPNWIETMRRFAKAGAIPVTPEQIDMLTSQ